MELLELLAHGHITEFNEARGSVRRVDLFAADLPGASLATADLTGASLAKADLSGADLTEASLIKADLSGIDGSGLKMNDALAVRVRLGDAWLEDADLSAADLTRANLVEAVLNRSFARDTVFTSANLRGVEAKAARWERADLAEAHLQRASFQGADLSHADLTETSAAHVDLSGARLEYVTGPRLRLGGANLQGASLVGARLQEANLSGADLTGADLTAADLSRANLTEAVLTGVTLRGAVLAGAVLDGVDLTGIDLTGVDLTGIDPRQLGLTEAQQDSLLGFGARFDPDAPVVLDELSVARVGDAVLAVWRNPEGEPEDEDASIRWALSTGEKGVFPVEARDVGGQWAVPWGDNLAVLLLQRRPAGLTLTLYPLADGATCAPVDHPLGYPPAAAPVVVADAGGLWVWGLRQGPSVVVQRLDAEGLHTRATSRVPTARAMLGAPILDCKGGVVIPVSERGAGDPLRTPPGFQPEGATGLAVDGRVFLTWVEPFLSEERPGGVRGAWLTRREEPQILPLGDDSGVTRLWRVGERIAWSEEGALQVIDPRTGARVEAPLEIHGKVVVGHEVMAVHLPRGGAILQDLDGEVLGRLASEWSER